MNKISLFFLVALLCVPFCSLHAKTTFEKRRVDYGAEFYNSTDTPEKDAPYLILVFKNVSTTESKKIDLWAEEIEKKMSAYKGVYHEKDYKILLEVLSGYMESFFKLASGEFYIVCPRINQILHYEPIRHLVW